MSAGYILILVSTFSASLKKNTCFVEKHIHVHVYIQNTGRTTGLISNKIDMQVVFIVLIFNYRV